ncbi:MAG: glycerol-3-phosphate 1-O-acyltransferase PlsY [Desulfovibrionaceae bacterium]
MGSVLWMAAAYLIGSVPFGLVVGKTLCGVDPRTTGSRNIGATNVARTCGTVYGVLVLVCDVLKGLLPVALAASSSDSAVFLSLTAFAAVCGHVFPIFLGFKGGKAVATTIGVFIPLCFWQLAMASAVCVALIAASGFVSVGSLGLVTALPILLLLSGRFDVLVLAIAIMLLVYWRHRDNIIRLARGEEKPWRGGKSSADTAPTDAA